jgi:hypothetical protein
MATEDYIPVAGDDWYQRRREDAEGEFFRKVADQGPRKGQGGSTRQGIYIFTASGKLLAYKNAQDAEVMREVLQRGLTAWEKLPADERKPSAVKIEELTKTDARYTRTPPPDGLILTVYTRILDEDDKGEFCKGKCGSPGGDMAARDHLWLTKSEWQGLIPANAKKGDEFALPAKIATRIARYHLIDNTRGEPPMWSAEEVRKVNVSMKVEAADDKTIRVRLEGAALLASNADATKAKRGYEASLLGTLVYDVVKKAITRFDMVALGDHWGYGTFTPGARVGRTSLGIAFELASGKPADLVPPQAARDFNDYMGK